MSKYRVYYVERGWMESVEVYEIEADSQEEAEENFLNGDLVDGWRNESTEDVGVDSERTKLIEE